LACIREVVACMNRLKGVRRTGWVEMRRKGDDGGHAPSQVLSHEDEMAGSVNGLASGYVYGVEIMKTLVEEKCFEMVLVELSNGTLSQS